MSAAVCPDLAAMTNWHAALTVISVLLPLAFLLAVVVLWRARHIGALAVVVAAVSALLAVVAEVASVMLWLRVRDMKAVLAYFTLPLYPSTCMTPDEYGHFSPPPVYYDLLRHALAQVASLERAAAVDVVVAVVALAAVIACALLWGRRRAPAPQVA